MHALDCECARVNARVCYVITKGAQQALLISFAIAYVLALLSAPVTTQTLEECSRR
eukprot:COSAG02_NODE_2884_length_7815_cov_95.201503_9_plen_56_part_00